MITTTKMKKGRKYEKIFEKPVYIIVLKKTMSTKRFIILIKLNHLIQLIKEP